MQELAGRVRMGLEHIPVPEVAAEVGIGDEQLVVREVGMVHGPVVHIGREDRSRDGGDQPILVIKAGRRDFLAGEGRLRGALQLPGPAGKQLAGAFADGGRLRHRPGAALTVHFPLAQLERLSVFGAGQAQADISALRPGELDFGLRPFEGGDILPRFPVPGSLDRCLHGAVDPGKAHLIKGRRLAEVDGDPFFLRAGTLPGADETGVREHIHKRIVFEEEHFIDLEAVRSVREMQPVRAISARNGDGELARMDEHLVLRRPDTGGTHRLPGAVFRLSLDGQDRLLVPVPAGGDQDPVRHGLKTVEDQLQIHLGTGAVDAGVVLVGQETAFQPGQPFSATENFHPGSGTVSNQSVRQELRRLVIVRAGGMPGSAQQRDVPVSVPLLERGREVLGGIAGIDADAQRLGPFVPSAGRRKQQRQENKCLFHLSY